MAISANETMPMYTQNQDHSIKKTKNIAAVVYLLVLIFLVGGSYINQHRADAAVKTESGSKTIEKN